MAVSSSTSSPSSPRGKFLSPPRGKSRAHLELAFCVACCLFDRSCLFSLVPASKDACHCVASDSHFFRWPSIMWYLFCCPLLPRTDVAPRLCPRLDAFCSSFVLLTGPFDHDFALVTSLVYVHLRGGFLQFCALSAPLSFSTSCLQTRNPVRDQP